MNAPNFEFGSDRHSGAQPLIFGEGRAIVDPGRGLANKAESPYSTWDESGSSEYRELFFKYLGIALKHRWIIVICAVGGLLAGFCVTYSATPYYQAMATIEISTTAPRVVKLDNSVETTSDRAGPFFYQTQLDLLKSRSLAEHVVADLDLGNALDFVYPKSSSPWANLWHSIFPKKAASNGNNGSYAQRKAIAVGRVIRGLSVEPVGRSSLVTISYSSPSPQWAQKIANGVAQTYIKTNMDRRYGATAYARQFLKDRLDELKLKLEKSEEALFQYSKKMKIVDFGDKSELVADLQAITDALNQVRMQRLKDEQFLAQAKVDQGMSLPQIQNDKSINRLRDKRRELSVEYQQKLLQFKPDYPDMRELRTQISQIDREIKKAAKSIVDVAQARYKASRDQELLLEEKVDAAKGNVLNQRSKGVQYRILQRDVETNRSLYNGLLKQYKDIGVAGAVGTNNVSMVDEALQPGAPYTPNLRP